MIILVFSGYFGVYFGVSLRNRLFWFIFEKKGTPHQPNDGGRRSL